MEPTNAARDPDAEERDAIRTDLRNALNVITGRTQLLQRQVLRADGLLNLERDQMLDGLTATLADVRRMTLRLEDLLVEKTTPVSEPAEPPLVKPELAAGVQGAPLTRSAHGLVAEPD